MGKPKQKRGRKKAKERKVIQDNQDVEFVCTLEARDQEEPETVEEQEEPQAVEEEEQPVEDVQAEQEEQHNTEEPEGELELSTNEEDAGGRNRKRKRGPTRMKDLAKDPSSRVHVDFNIMGEAYGSGSVKLSSYLGPSVREHVPVTLEGWKKVSDEVKKVLWKSVQARFEIDEDYHRDAVLKQLGSLWRSSKSRLVTQINEADNNQQRMKLRPKNVTPVEWRKFVKLKTSREFKVVSDSYKERRSKQIPHTCSRKGMVRLAEEMKSNSGDPSEVTRLKIWVKSRTRKDGTPINTNAAEKIQKAAELVNDNAEVWRKSDEIETLKDAHGSAIAWPLDKLVIF